MKHNNHNDLFLPFTIVKVRPSLYHATVAVPAPYIDALFDHIISSFQKTLQAPGFSKGNVPRTYIQQHFSHVIAEYIKEFCSSYFVFRGLYTSISEHKILVAGEPRLLETSIQPHADGLFTFELSSIPPIDLREWKHLPFKTPKRKQYKDLDRQATSFIKQEQLLLKECSLETIDIGDWVYFTIEPVNDLKEPLFDNYAQRLWLKIGNEDVDRELRKDFLQKHVGETFFTLNEDIQRYFCGKTRIQFMFKITIHDVIQNRFFCLDSFKRCFKLKTKKEALQKIIEVFSYQHDLSQRRAIVEKSLSLLLSKNKFTIPNHVILRQQKRILDYIKHTPDYHVYRTQKDFNRRIEQLAKKQASEMILLDKISYQENIIPSHEDICHYLNLTKRPRTKEFVYFNPPSTKINGQEVPISEDELKNICQREKTLNYIIHHLTQ